MPKNLLRALLIILVNIISIAYSKAQDSDSVICLKTRQIDFLILEQVDAVGLRKDTLYKGIVIRSLNKIITKQADIESKTSLIVKTKEEQLKGCQKTSSELADMYKKEYKRKKAWRNATVVFGGTTLILSGLIFLLAN